MMKKIISYKPFKSILYYIPVYFFFGMILFLLEELSIIKVATSTEYRLISTVIASILLGLLTGLYPLMGARLLGIRNHVNVLYIDSSNQLYIDKYKIEITNIKRICSHTARHQTLYTIELKELPSDLMKSLGYNRKTIIYANKNIFFNSNYTNKILLDNGLPKEVFHDTPINLKDLMGWPDMLD